MKSWKGVLKRMARVAVAVIIPTALAYYANNPLMIGLAPVISALGKFLREQYNLKNVPF